MHQLINKKKIYFYIASFFILSSIFNINFKISNNNFFLIKTFKIQGGQEESRSKFREKLNLIGKNIYNLNKDEINGKIKNLRFLKNAEIKKVYPSKLLVIIEETDLIAKTIVDGKKYFIGQNEKFIPSNDFKVIKNLPNVFGNFKISDLLNVIDLLKRQNFDVSLIKNFYFHKNKRWDIQLVDESILKLPSQNLDIALKTYSFFIKKNYVENKSIIDLRIPNRIIISNEK